MVWSMNLSTDLRRGRTCVFMMHVHLVFVTKFRRKVFTKTILHDLRSIFTDVCNDFEAQLIEFEGEGDHIHLLVNYPPKISLSKLVGSLKGVSSRLIREKNYPEVTKKLWGENLWSPSYFAGSCGGAPLDIIKTYIEQQERPKWEVRHSRRRALPYITHLKEGVLRQYSDKLLLGSRVKMLIHMIGSILVDAAIDIFKTYKEDAFEQDSTLVIS